MARKSFVFLAVGMFIFFCASVSSADVPDSINYQGKLTTAEGGCLNDTVQMIFTIYSDSLGTQSVWTETQHGVIVTEGVFNVLLGSVRALHDTIFDEPTRYLGVQVESDPEMRPLKPMVTVPYAFRVSTVDGASGGTIHGDVNIEGDVIITGDTIYVGDIYIEPTTRYYSIPPCAFVCSGHDGYTYTYHDSYGTSPTAGPEDTLYAPVNLPHGAVINKLVFYFFFGPIQTWETFVDVQFIRKSFSSLFAPVDTLGNALFSGETPHPDYYDSLVVTNFLDPVIDDGNYCYTLKIAYFLTAAEHCQQLGARIEYVIDKPLP